MDNPRLMKAKLSQTGLHCTLEWVEAFMDWCREEQPGLDVTGLLFKMQEQWTITDITTDGVMERFVLPPGISDAQNPAKTVLQGQYPLQVQYAYDIGSPAYGQLQKLHNVDLENARVSAEDSQASQAGGGGYQATQGGQFQQSWEPRPQRMLMLSLTDGRQTIEAMEHGTVKKLPDQIRPGAKIKVQGPVTVRRGMILLQDHNIHWLGGEVDDLAEQFSLKTILQQKIGKEDVGQKGNMFADNSSGPPVNIPVRPRDRQQRQAPAPAAPVRAPVQPPPLPQLGQGQVDSLEDMMDDDDDDALLLAASQVEETDNQPPPPPAASTTSTWSRPRAVSAGPPVGVVEPLRTIEPSNKRQLSERDSSNANKMKSQASITSFIKPKENKIQIQKPSPAQNDTGVPSFSLMDSDEETFTEELLAEMHPAPQIKPNIPFSYLVHFKKELSLKPGQCLSGKFKVVSSTLASKLHHKRTNQGPQWSVMIMLNDGSDSVKADISADILTEEIGSASQYLTEASRDPNVKAKMKANFKKFSMKLAELNCIVTIESDKQQSLTVTQMEEINGLHLAQMRRRKK